MYFTYRLQTQDAAGTIQTNAMRDPARVYVGVPTANEVQQLTFDLGVSSGQFRLQYGDMISGLINWAANTTTLAGNIQTALNAAGMFGTNNTSVSWSAGRTYTITFQNNLAGANLQALTLAPASALVGGTATVTTQTEGSGNEVQVLDFSTANVGEYIGCGWNGNTVTAPPFPPTYQPGTSPRRRRSRRR